MNAQKPETMRDGPGETQTGVATADQNLIGTMRDPNYRPIADRLPGTNGHPVNVVPDDDDDDDDTDDDDSGDDEADVYDEHEAEIELKVRERIKDEQGEDVVGEDGRPKTRVVVYVAGELGQGAMARYMKAFAKRMKSQNRAESPKEFDDFLLTLICGGVRQKDTRQLVSRAKAAGWGFRLKFQAFKLVQQVNGMDDKVVEREGKG